MVTIPHDYLCPISLEIMLDPVFTSDGETYGREHIEEWFFKGNRTSPANNTVLADTTLKPNLAIKRAINSFIEQYKNQFQSALADAIMKGDLPEIESLMRLKLDLNKTDENGWTYLLTAISQGHIAVVDYLLKHKVSVENSAKFTRELKKAVETPVATDNYFSGPYLALLKVALRLKQLEFEETYFLHSLSQQEQDSIKREYEAIYAMSDQDIITERLFDKALKILPSDDNGYSNKPIAEVFKKEQMKDAFEKSKNEIENWEIELDNLITYQKNFTQILDINTFQALIKHMQIPFFLQSKAKLQSLEKTLSFQKHFDKICQDALTIIQSKIKKIKDHPLNLANYTHVVVKTFSRSNYDRDPRGTYEILIKQDLTFTKIGGKFHNAYFGSMALQFYWADERDGITIERVEQQSGEPYKQKFLTQKEALNNKFLAINETILKKYEELLADVQSFNPNPPSLEVHNINPLHLAVYFEKVELVKKLIQEKIVDVNGRDEHGWSALHYAAYEGKSLMIEILLDLGADVNAKTPQEETALHIAIRYGHVAIINDLIKQGADTESQNKLLQSPKTLALDLGRLDFAALIATAHQGYVKSQLSMVTSLHTLVKDLQNQINLLKQEQPQNNTIANNKTNERKIDEGLKFAPPPNEDGFKEKQLPS
jgi:ankyrin repeat protein